MGQRVAALITQARTREWGWGRGERRGEERGEEGCPVTDFLHPYCGRYCPHLGQSSLTPSPLVSEALRGCPAHLAGLLGAFQANQTDSQN